MIEVIRDSDSGKKARLIINGHELPGDMYYLSSGVREGLWFHLYDDRFLDEFLEIAPAEYAEQFERVELSMAFGWTDLVQGVELQPRDVHKSWSTRPEGDPPNLRFQFRFNWEEWKNPWSITEFADAMAVATLHLGNDKVRWALIDELVSSGCDLILDLDTARDTLGDHLNRYDPIARKVYQEAIARLIQELRPGALVTAFHLPAETRVACEQYLLYFIQFLRDLGFEATGDVEEKAGQVLFTVTPASDKQALGLIREALDIYLKLPSQGDWSMIDHAAEPEVQRLQANILHLQSQVHLARALIESKDATIAAYRVATAAQEVLRDGGLATGVRRIDQPERSTELLPGGVVTLTTYEKHGVIIDLPELYRRLRALFRRDT